MKPQEEIIISEPISESDWKQYFALRYRVLRQPWNEPQGSEKLVDDAQAIHALAKEKSGRVVGVGRLHMQAPGMAQVRMMAVDPEFQGAGIGKMLMQWLEQKAVQIGAGHMMLEARENALTFYRGLGYKAIKRSYLLFGTIQHYTMTKALPQNENNNENKSGKAWQLLSPHGLLLVGGVVLAGAALMVLNSCRPQQKKLETVAQVDLQRYLGLWYEIARYPNRFEEGCSCITAEYSKHPDGHITVLNSCRKPDAKNGIEVAEGKAFVVEGSNNTQLRVQFQWPFKGDYWIIDLADDYRYAVVSEPEREYLWILSRTPKMQVGDYDAVLQRLNARGFDLSNLIVVDQSCF